MNVHSHLEFDMYALFSSSDYTKFLNSILKWFYRYGGTLMIITGTFGSLAMLFMSITSNKRQSSLKIYSFARNLSNLLYIYLSLLYFTLALGFDVNPSSYNLAYCRFSIYMSFVFEIISPSYLILSMFDQILAQKMKNRQRKEIQRRHFAIISCSIASIFWMLFHLHSWFLARILQSDFDYFYCYLRPGLYTTLITYYSLWIKVLLVPIFLIVVTYMLIRNESDHQPPIFSIYLAMNHYHSSYQLTSSKDRDTMILLIKDMIIYLTFNSLSSVYILYELITQNHTRSLEHIEIEHFIRYIGIFFAGFPFVIVFYTNLMASKMYRQQVLKCFSSKMFCRCRYRSLTNRVHP